MRVKEESEKAGLKLNIQKTSIMVSGPITSWQVSEVTQSWATLWDSMDYTQSTEFYRPEHWSGLPFPSPGDLPNPETEPRSPALQADSLSAEPAGKPKNTEVGSQSLLQQIFPTQRLNPGLLHCRWILYQLSHRGAHDMACLHDRRENSGSSERCSFLGLQSHGRQRLF